MFAESSSQHGGVTNGIAATSTLQMSSSVGGHSNFNRGMVEEQSYPLSFQEVPNIRSNSLGIVEEEISHSYNRDTLMSQSRRSRGMGRS